MFDKNHTLFYICGMSKSVYEYSTDKNQHLILDIVTLKARHKMKTEKFNPYDAKLDPEEKEFLKSFEQGEWKSVNNLAQEMENAKTIATNTLRKDARITLRISNRDLANLKQQAAYKGLPYQTFIASVLHEYAAGHF